MSEVTSIQHTNQRVASDVEQTADFTRPDLDASEFKSY